MTESHFLQELYIRVSATISFSMMGKQVSKHLKGNSEPHRNDISQKTSWGIIYEKTSSVLNVWIDMGPLSHSLYFINLAFNVYKSDVLMFLLQDQWVLC